jgi:phosphoglycolate phosphatase-like HAD superfamily hydrolase
MEAAKKMKKITVIITDLDNTLFDWVRIWHEPFKAMLGELVRASGIDEATLTRDIKQVFTQRGTTEYAFVIQEIKSLQDKYPGENLTQKFDSAIHAFRSARKRVVALYPDVEETLQVLKDRGVLIIGYTESQEFYTHYRMRTLGLDRIVDFIYSPADHDLPEGLTPEQVRLFAPEHYRLRRAVHRNTPDGEVKPNPKVLLQIIRDVGAVPDEAAYIGDSQMKDIAMAQDAGVTDVWAEYGFAVHRPEYELLRQVTHWSKENVEKEKDILASPPKASHVLQKSFGELLGLFDFQPFVDRSDDRMELAVEAWKVAVDAQKHFNDLEMRVRNFALTLVTAALAAAGLIFKDDIRLRGFGVDFPLGSAIILTAIPIWVAFYLVDRFWYHNLLLGAVRHGQFIERRHEKVIPELGLAGAIGKASPTPFFRWKIHSSRKIDLFYLLGVLVLVLASVGSLFAVRAAEGVPEATRPAATAGANAVPKSPGTGAATGAASGGTAQGTATQAPSKTGIAPALGASPAAKAASSGTGSQRPWGR